MLFILFQTKYNNRVQRICCKGYVLKNKKCVPHCAKGCENGKCVKPNECECFKGYKKFSKLNPYRWVFAIK